MLALCALACAPAAASADTYCVNEPLCRKAGGKEKGNDGKAVKRALEAAAAHVNSGGPDVVVIGPGTYTLEPGYSYTSDEAVLIRGAGEGATVLRAGERRSAVLTLESPESTLEGVTLEVPEGGERVGLALDGGGAQDVAVVAGERKGEGSPQTTGLAIAAGSFSAGSVELPVAGDTAGVSFEGGGEVRGSTIVAAEGVSGRAPETLRGCRISGAKGGVAGHSGPVTVEDSLIDLRGGAGAGVSVLGNGAGRGEATLRGLTIVNGGAGSTGLLVQAKEGASATAVLQSSVIAYVAHAIVELGEGAGSTAAAAGDYSSYESAGDEQLGEHGAVAPAPPPEENAVAGAPGFVAPVLGEGGFGEGDWHPSLSPRSPLIDAGVPGPLAAGEYELDAEGNPRVVGPSRDVGAFEYQRRAPSVSAGASSATATVGQPITFSGVATVSEPGDVLAGEQWSFDDGGVGTVDAGSVAHAFSTPGTHTATFTALDALGLEATATVSVSVSAAPAGSGSGSGPRLPFGFGGPKLGGLGEHGVAGSRTSSPARLSGLRVSPRSFRAARSGPSVKRYRHLGARVSFHLSKAGSVSFAVERLVRGYVHGRRCRPYGHGRAVKRCTLRRRMRGGFARSAGAGADALHFSGRLGGRTLAPGSYVLVASVPGRASLTAPFAVLR
ncbi:MAG TPA: PKD domain-containing protein [Solirubrobacteraceae bacterium]|nr:PKD domain-containing protein [Solirubrobacteraceae bacterium]